MITKNKFMLLSTLLLSLISTIAVSKTHDTKLLHKHHVHIPHGRIENGTASYYADAFHGKKTASGVIFNMYSMTAAHKTLPLGTLLKVTNRKNKKTVIVKVLDRGPYVGNRILDLSKGAANVIGMNHKNGLAKVQIEVL